MLFVHGGMVSKEKAAEEAQTILGGVLNYFNKQPEVIVLLVILYKTQ